MSEAKEIAIAALDAYEQGLSVDQLAEIIQKLLENYEPKEKETLEDLVSMSNELKCAVCDSINVHPTGLLIYCGNDDYEITKALEVKEGLDMTFKNVKKKADHRVRGLSYTLEFACESLHTWKRSFAFHKGSTYVKDFDLGEA